MKQVLSIEEIINFLSKEINKSKRFPTIFVFLGKQSSFKKLLNFLKIKSRLLNLANLCPEKDLIPLTTIEKIVEYLKQEEGPLCIVPFCAWFRLNIGHNPAKIILKELASLEGKNYPRIIVPLLDPTKQIFATLNELSRCKENEGALILKLEEQSKAHKLYVSFPIEGFKPFEGYLFNGIKEYLDYFSSPSSEEEFFWLFTKATKAIKPNTFIEVLSTPKEVIQKIFPELETDLSFNGDFWKEILLQTTIYKTKDFEVFVKKIFNISEIKTKFFLSNWKEFGEFKKKLAILWAKNQTKKDIWTEILAHSTPEKLIENVYFNQKILVTSLKERKAILQKLAPYPLIEEKLPKDPLICLRLLTDNTQKERQHTLKLVSKILKDLDFVPDEILEILETNFPLLAFYLKKGTSETEAEKYFFKYRLNKLAQKILPWPSVNLETFPTREEKITNSNISPEYQIWLDGLGVEWLEIFKWFLERQGISFNISLVRANLPTITETNRPPKGALFWRELDEIGHKYRSDPLESILLEFDEVERILSRLYEKILQGNCLLITADHGLTWSLFHKEKIPLPPGAEEPHRAGRVARIKKLTKIITSSEFWKTDRDDKYLCLARQGYFEGSKRPPQREFHGGALPEEVLVPLIIISREKEADFNFYIIKPETRLDSQGKFTIELKIDPYPKEKIWLIIADKKVPVEKKKERFLAEITDLKAGTYTFNLLVGERSIGSAQIKVLPPAIIEEDLGF